jgi:hypothetical protein
VSKSEKDQAGIPLVEWKERKSSESRMMPLDKVVTEVSGFMAKDK